MLFCCSLLFCSCPLKLCHAICSLKVQLHSERHCQAVMQPWVSSLCISSAPVCHCRSNPLGQKTRTERKGAPCFSTLVEVLGYARWRVHPNVARSVDALLAGEQPVTQLREMQGSKMLMTIEKAEPASLGVHSRQPSNCGAPSALPTWMQQLQAYSK